MKKYEKMWSVPALPLEASHMDFPVAAIVNKIHLSKNLEEDSLLTVLFCFIT